MVENGRKLVKSTIDYVCGSNDLSSETDILDDDFEGYGKSDHRVVAAYFSRPTIDTTSSAKCFSLKRWEPVDDSEMEAFQEQSLEVLQSSSDISFIQDAILRIGQKVHYLNSALKVRKDQNSKKLEDEEALTRIKNSGSLNVHKERKKLKRARGKERRKSQLKTLTVQGHFCSSNITHILVNEEFICERSQWISEATKFGENKYNDPLNQSDDEISRMSYLASDYASYQSSGGSFEFGRATLGSGAPGIDEIPTEMWKALLYVAIVRMWQIFQRLSHDYTNLSYPDIWTITRLVGIPKDALLFTYFDDLRWIGLMNTLQKWLQRSQRPFISASISKSRVHSYGFKRYRSVNDIHGLIRPCMSLAYIWQGVDLCIGVGDILTAFDCAKHGRILQALLKGRLILLYCSLELKNCLIIKCH